MNFPPEMNPHFADSNIRPFYMPAMAQPFSGPWFHNSSYNPLCFPGTAFRNGSPWFPYPSAFSGYPAFLVPPSPLPTMFSQRPIIPMASYTGRIQPCNFFGERQTKNTQTGPEQDENLHTEQDTDSQAVNNDISNATSTPSTLCKETDHIGRTWYFMAPEGWLHGTIPKITLNRHSHLRNTTASEKKVRERGSGSPTAEFQKTFKERVRLYDLAYGEGKPEDVAHHNGNSQCCCECSNVLCNHAEGEDIYTKQGSWKMPEHYTADEMDGECEINAGREINMSKEKNGYGSVSQSLPSWKTRDVQLEKGQKKMKNKEGKEERQLTSSKAAGDLRLHFSAQRNPSEKRKPGSRQNHCPSPTQPAQRSKVNKDIQLCMRTTDKQHLTGRGLSGPELEPEVDEEAEDTEPYEQEETHTEEHDRSEELYREGMDPFSEFSSDSYVVFEGDNSEVNEAICDMTSTENTRPTLYMLSESDFEPDVDELYEELCEEEEDIEVHKVPEWPCEEKCLTPSRKSQFIPFYLSERANAEVEEAVQLDAGYNPYIIREEEIVIMKNDTSTQCDKGATEKEHLLATGNMSLSRENSWPHSPATVESLASKKGSEKIVKNRKYNIDEEMVQKDDVKEAGDHNLKSSPKIRNTLKGREREAKAVSLLKRNVRFNNFPEDLEDSDDVCEVECVFQETREKSRLILHKGSVYREIGRVIKCKKFPSPQTSVRHAGKKGKEKLGTYESIPQACRPQVKQGCEMRHGGLQKSTPTKQKELECKTTSPKSTEW